MEAASGSYLETAVPQVARKKKKFFFFFLQKNVYKSQGVTDR